jgi:hypothetical protein
MSLQIETVYTRPEIQAALGGQPRDYLPYSRAVGRIVAACLTTELNPEAPNIILCGSSAVVALRGEQLCQQGGTIPVFVREAPNQWRHKGMYRVDRYSLDPDELRRFAAAAEREAISRIIWLVPDPTTEK